MNKRIQYIQLAGDALIPLLGFYLWDWSLYFILLFYFADLIIGEVFTWVRSEKLRKAREGRMKTQAVIAAGFSAAFLVSSILLMNIAIRFLHPDLIIVNELIAFWTYKEMGIEQGYVLLPLLILVSYQQYKLEFVLNGRFRTQTIRELWGQHVRNRTVLMSVSGIAASLLYFFNIPDVWVLWTVILCTGLYSLYFIRM
jgi:hypothetical protein